MTTISLPDTTVNIIGANATVSNAIQKVLFVGQQINTDIAERTLVENIGINEEGDLFDPRSMLANMIRTARNQNDINVFDAIPLDDAGASVAAVGSVEFDGSSTGAGTITVVVGSAKEWTVTMDVASGTADTSIATFFSTEFDLFLESVFTNTVVSGDIVQFTASNAGTLGNSIGISVTSNVPGINITVTQFSGGAIDPSLTNIFDVIADKRYQAIVWPYWADTAVLTDELEARFNVNNNVLDGVGFTSSVDSLSNHLSRLNAYNFRTLVDFCSKETDEDLFKGPDMLEYLPNKSSMFAAIRARRLTPGASISDVVLASNGPLDAFGGPALASKPYFNTPMKDLSLTGVGRGFPAAEINQLNDAGGSVIGNNIAGNSVITGEVVTTYKTDAAGNEDISFKYLNYVDTSSGIREYYFNNLRSRFAQTRLTEGSVVKGRDQVNAVIIRAFCEKLYQDLAGADYVLVEDGEDAIVFYKNNLTVVIDKANGSVTLVFKTAIVTQLRSIIATHQIAFTTNQ